MSANTKEQISATLFTVKKSIEGACNGNKTPFYRIFVVLMSCEQWCEHLEKYWIVTV